MADEYLTVTADVEGLSTSVSGSGTYTFQPSFLDLVYQAFFRCGIPRNAVLTEHLQTAKMEANLLQVEMVNRGVTLWTITEQTIPLLSGVSTYSVPTNTVMITDAWIRTTTGGVPNDRLVLNISRDEYAAYPNKETAGFPTVYWFNRQIDPEITVWPVPNATGTYTLKLYSYIQIQDAIYVGTTTTNVPYLFFDVYVAGLAKRLARIWAKDRISDLTAEYESAWAIASNQNTENTNLYVTPVTNGYWRR